MVKYPAKIVLNDDDGVFEVDFPDLPGCITYGETLIEAEEMAKEALTGYLVSIDGRSMNIPKPSEILEKDIYYIKPTKKTAFAIYLKLKRQELGLTQEDIARELDIQYQTYQRIENPSTSNPTLSTIAKLEKIIGSEIIVV